MSLSATSAVWEHSEQRGDALVVLHIIADGADDNWIAQTPNPYTICRLARMTPEEVDETIEYLYLVGELKLTSLGHVRLFPYVARDRETYKKQSINGGRIYLVASPDGYYKIGKTRKLTERLRSFGLQLPFPVRLLVEIETDDIHQLERNLHTKFAHCRTNGEWFKLSDDDVTWFQSLPAKMNAMEPLP